MVALSVLSSQGLNPKIIQKLAKSLEENVNLANLRTDYIFSYSRHQINKPDKDAKINRTEFLGVSGSLNELKEIVKKGYAIAPCRFKQNYRKKENSERFTLIIADIDNAKINENGEKVYDEKLTIEQALKNDFIAKFGAIYTTPSHTEKWNRYRLIFALPTEVNHFEYEPLLKIVNEFCSQAIDPDAMEAGKLFYGNTKAKFYNWENFHSLPYKFVLEARKLAEMAKHQAEEINKLKIENKARFNNFPTEVQEIQKALSYISSGCDYNTWLRVGFGLFDYFNGSDDGFSLFDEWSSTGSKYDGTEKLLRKWQTFNNSNFFNKSTIATVFHLAKENGYKVSVNHSVNDSKDKVISEQEWLEKDHQKTKKPLTDKIGNLISNLFGIRKPKKSDPSLSDSSIRYKSDSEKLNLIKKHRYIVDKTITGGGKSYFAGENTTDLLMDNQLDKLWYLSQDHTNPTNENIRDNYVNLWPRHKGMIYDEYGRLVHSKSNQQPDIAPNCKHTYLFNQLTSQGHQINKPTYDKNSKLFSNPICAICPERYTCRSGQGEENDPNYLYSRRKTLASTFIRASLEQFDINYDCSQDGLIIEEFDKEFDNLTKNCEVREKDLRILSSYLLSYFDFENITLANLLGDLIRNFFLNIISRRKEIGKHGLDFEKLKALLLDYYFNYLFKSHCELDKDFVFKLIAYIPENQIISILSDIAYLSFLYLQASLLKINKLIDLTKITLKGKYQDKLETINEIPSNFIEHFIDIICGKKQGYIRLVKGKVDQNNNISPTRFICTYQDERKLKAIREAKKLILLSATPKSKKAIAQILDCDPSEIIFIEKDIKSPKNHTIRILTNNKGIKSNNWSDQAKNRVKSIVEQAIEDKNLSPDDIIVHGKQSILQDLDLNIPDTHFWSGVDRGSNLFSHKKYQVICGKPQQDFGSAAAVYQTLFGTKEGLEDYYQELIENDILQLTGRPRAINRPNEKIETLLIVDQLDPQFLINSGYSVKIENLLDSQFVGDALSEKQKRFQIIRNSLPSILATLKYPPSLKILAKKLKMKVKDLSRDLKELNLSMDNVKSLWKELKIVKSKNSQKAIETYIENCEFLPDWFKTMLSQYFSYLHSKEELPFWDVNFDEIEINMDLLVFTGWFLFLEPKYFIDYFDIF